MFDPHVSRDPRKLPIHVKLAWKLSCHTKCLLVCTTHLILRSVCLYVFLLDVCCPFQALQLLVDPQCYTAFDGDNSSLKFNEPVREKTNNLGSDDLVRHKPVFTSTETD